MQKKKLKKKKKNKNGQRKAEENYVELTGSVYYTRETYKM